VCALLMIAWSSSTENGHQSIMGWRHLLKVQTKGGHAVSKFGRVKAHCSPWNWISSVKISSASLVQRSFIVGVVRVLHSDYECSCRERSNRDNEDLERSGESLNMGEK
jgi:hypothetical protein